MTGRYLMLAAVFGLSLTTSGFADEPTGAETARDVIANQLDAFDREAVADAYRHAAPNIQRMFPTPERFGSMVRNGYPMVWDPAETMFLDAETRGDVLVQRLRLIDKAGRAYIAEYMMTQIDGVWRIAGVQIVEDKSYGV